VLIDDVAAQIDNDLAFLLLTISIRVEASVLHPANLACAFDIKDVNPLVRCRNQQEDAGSEDRTQELRFNRRMMQELGRAV
jgi:hypothetical protein